MKRFLSIILTIVMLVSSMSNILVFASDGNTSLENGDTVVLYAFLSDNPGVSELVLSFEYDSSAMNLVKVTNGEAMSDATYTGPKNLASGCMATWYYIDEPDYFKDGSLVALEFEIVDSEALENKYPLSVVIVSADGVNGTVFDLQNNIRVIDYRPGDVNGDGIHSLRYDVSEFNQYIVDGCKYDPLGYAVQINENAADVNNDGVITIKDVIDVNKYIVDGGVYDPNGYAVKLYPHIEKCKHTSLTAVPAKEATCTEDGNIAYWICDDCGKYFADEEVTSEIYLSDTIIDAKGHTEISIPAIKPTETEAGATEGKKCSVCGAVTVEPEAIAPLTGYVIEYKINDTYLEKIGVSNPNKKTYTEEDTANGPIELIDLEADGYKFRGWSLNQSSEDFAKITEIPQGSKKNFKLYAHWEKDTYWITFDSPDYPIKYTGQDDKGNEVTYTNEVSYTVDKGKTLINPDDQHGYTFVGWSDNDGFFVNEIKPGTTGNITLHANWTSERNKATAYSSYGEPIIIENAEDKQYLFVYKIGEINNIPIKEIKDLEWRTAGSSLEISKEYTTEITVDNTTAISNTIADATTRSSGWTLSKDWEEEYSFESESGNASSKSDTRTNSSGQTVGGEYFVSNSNSGSSYVSSECGGSTATSSKVTTEQSSGINGSLDIGSKAYCSAKVGVENKTEVGASVKAPIPIGVAEASVKNTTTVGASVESGREDTLAVHFDGHMENYVGTYNSVDTNSYYNSSVSNTSAWNTNQGYTQSKEQSNESSVSNAIVEEISKREKINISNAVSETNSVNGKDEYSETESNTYASTVRAAKGSTVKETYNDTQIFPANGYYRIVLKGKAHVYGVVGYDIASNSFYTYTYSVMEDETKPWLDFSLNDPDFEDCENAIIPFKVPTYPLEYVSFLTGKSAGLEFDLDDKLTGFDEEKEFESIEEGNEEGNEEEKLLTVVIPQYYGAYNGKDGTYKAVTVESFDGNENVFKGKTSIETVILPKSITEIPEGAFEGCTNLKSVMAYGITSIGANAFKDCVNLDTFTVDKFVTYLGANAFENVGEIRVEAANIDVFNAALNSGAKRITLSMHSLEKPLSNKTITVSSDTEMFALLDNGKEHSNLVIDSNASETYISNMTFVENESIPLNISSDKLTLNRVSVVDAPRLALKLDNNDTALYLYGTVSLSSLTDNVVLCKDVVVRKENSEVNGTLNLEGKMIVCGEDGFEGKNRITATKGIVFVDKSRYDSILKSHIVTFNTLGGSPVEYQLIEDGTNLIEPADPTKNSNTFLGWYTDEECTEEFDFNTPVTSDITLYAKWKLNEFTLTFNANEGAVSTTSRKVIYGEKYGTLPTPTRTGYTFNGWYTATSGGTKITADTTVTATANHTLYAQWTLNAYKVSWSNATGVTISVKRTSSPYANAPTGSLSTGNTVNYGDVLSVTYSTQTGYTKTSNGKTTLTVTGNITSEHIYATATLNSYKVNWTVPTGGSITVKRTSSPLAGATTGTLSSGNTVYHGDVLAITYSANTGYSVATKGKTSVTVAGNITNSDIYLTVTPNDYTYNIVYKSSNGTALDTDTVTKAFATTNTVTPKTFAGYDTPASQSVKWDATSKTITFTYTPTTVATKTISKSKVIRYKDQYVSVEAVVEHQNRTKDSIQIRINWTVIHNGPLNPTFYHGTSAKAVIGSVSNTTKITTYSYSAHVKDQRYSKASDWITVPLDSTEASNINISVSTWQTNANGTNISTGGGSNYTDYKDTWSIAVPAY